MIFFESEESCGSFGILMRQVIVDTFVVEKNRVKFFRKSSFLEKNLYSYLK